MFEKKPMTGSEKVTQHTCPCGGFMARTGYTEETISYTCPICKSSMVIRLDAIQYTPSDNDDLVARIVAASIEADQQHMAFLSACAILRGAFPDRAGSYVIGVMYADGNSYKMAHGGGIIERVGLAGQIAHDVLSRAERSRGIDSLFDALVENGVIPKPDPADEPA